MPGGSRRSARMFRSRPWLVWRAFQATVHNVLFRVALRYVLATLAKRPLAPALQEKTEGRSPPLEFRRSGSFCLPPGVFCLRPERRQGRAHPPRGPHEILGSRVARDTEKILRIFAPSRTVVLKRPCTTRAPAPLFVGVEKHCGFPNPYTSMLTRSR